MIFDQKDLLLFLRVVDGCNLNCSHCFTLGNEPKIKLAPISIMKDFLSLVKDNIKPDNGLIYLHGGETFLAPLSYLKEITDFIKELFNDDFKILPQTNLVFPISDEFIKFIKEDCNGHIGCSWDKEIRFGSVNPAMRTRQEQLFFSNLKKLIDNNISVHITITVQKYLLDTDPLDLIQQFNGVKSIDFEHLTTFNELTETLRVNLRDWADWLDRLVSYYQHNETTWCLPQVDLFTESLISGKSFTCKCSCCYRRTLTINPNGTIGICPDTTYINPTSSIEKAKENWNGFSDSIHEALINRLIDIHTDNCFSCEHYNECTGNCEDALFDDSGECPLSKKVIKRVKENITDFTTLYETRAKENLLEFEDGK